VRNQEEFHNKVKKKQKKEKRKEKKKTEEEAEETKEHEGNIFLHNLTSRRPENKHFPNRHKSWLA